MFLLILHKILLDISVLFSIFVLNLMRILNPLYDWAFKYLMDNNEVAKKFLSILLKKEVIHLESRNIEMPLLKEGNPLLSRFDFKAIIQTREDETETVLIEIQKYKGTNPIERFRTYLAENYLKQETYKTEQGEVKTESLPIIAVYILGYCPPEFKVPYVIVRNEAYDGVIDEKIELDSFYVKLLTHTAYFLIVSPPVEYQWRNSPQEALIRLFRQKTSVNEHNTTYELEGEPEPILRDVVKYLHRGTQEEEVIKQIKAEEEYYQDLASLEFSNLQLKKEHEQLKTLFEQEKQRSEEKEKLLQEEKQRSEEKEKLLQEEKQRAENAQQKIIELARMLKELKVPIHEITQKTGLSRDEIERL